MADLKNPHKGDPFFDPDGYAAAHGQSVNVNGSGASTTGGGTTTPQGGGLDNVQEAPPNNGTLVSSDGGNDPSNILVSIPKGTAPLDGGDVLKAWRERVANYSPWNDVFSMTQQETQMVVDVPFDNRFLFTAFMLGFSWLDGDRLRRVNPPKHPQWTWMRCARVAHQGVRYAGNRVYFTGYGNVGVARYKLARFTLGFANFPWNFREDADIETDPLGEMTRNCFWSIQPSSQFIASEGGASMLGYAYSSSPSVAGAKFKAPFGTICSQIKYVLHWKWVPFDFVFKELVPVNLYAAQDKLNDGTFGPWAKGTMRFEPPQFSVYVAPIRTAGMPSLLCDIDMPMVFFDPPRGITSGSGSEWRGHNLVPHRINNLWYPAVRPDAGGTYGTDLDNKGLFSYTNFDKLFKKPV